MSLIVAKCTEECWDSKKCKHYYPGDQDEIDTEAEIAMHFQIPIKDRLRLIEIEEQKRKEKEARGVRAKKMKMTLKQLADLERMEAASSKEASA